MHEPSSAPDVGIASSMRPRGSRTCDECAQVLSGKTEIVLGFGVFHPECVATCPHGWLWPISVATSDEVTWYCLSCATEAGRSFGWDGGDAA